MVSLPALQASIVVNIEGQCGGDKNCEYKEDDVEQEAQIVVQQMTARD